MPKNESTATPSIDVRSAVSPANLARRWGKCRQTIYNMIDAGELHSFKVRNSRLIPFAEIERIERGES
jgi:excisionase family DNA binding protein